MAYTNTRPEKHFTDSPSLSSSGTESKRHPVTTNNITQWILNQLRHHKSRPTIID